MSRKKIRGREMEKVKNLTREEKIKIARRTYFRRYRNKNKSKVKENIENFWLRKFNELQENQASN